MGYRRYRRHKDDSFEEFTWVLFLTVLLSVFVLVFIMGFFKHCIFEWPIRWDMRTCWNEQVDPAKDAAIEKTIDFMPRLKK